MSSNHLFTYGGDAYFPYWATPKWVCHRFWHPGFPCRSNPIRGSYYTRLGGPKDRFLTEVEFRLFVRLGYPQDLNEIFKAIKIAEEFGADVSNPEAIDLVYRLATS